MKVLHVLPSMDPKAGGVRQAVQSIVTGLSHLEVYSEIACLDADTAPFLPDTVCPAHALGPMKGPWLYSPKLLPWFMENLLRFDRVIIHGLWFYHAYAAHKARRLLKRKNPNGSVPKFFVMPHGMLDPYFQRAPDRKLKAIRDQIYWRLIEGPIINKADGLFFTCETERRLAAEPFSSYAPKRESVVGLGVEEPPDYKEFMQQAFFQKCPQAKGQPYLLFLGRIDKKKGVELLLEAYAKVYRQANAPKLIIAGPGLETDYGQRMQQLAVDLRLQSVVFFPGMLTGEAKWGAFYGCEAFVLPSHQENFGIAIVEALACGRPVLISDQVNIWREITNAGGGLVCTDTTEGVQKMLSVWRQQTEKNKASLGGKARAAFEKHFAVTSASDHLLKAIDV